MRDGGTGAEQGQVSSLDGWRRCEGSIVVVCVSLSRMRPRAIPENIAQEFKSGS